MRKKLCAALSALVCAALLAGCSTENTPVNVYLPADAVIANPSSSVSSSVGRAEYPSDWIVNTPESSSSEETPVVTPTEQETPEDIDNSYLGKWYYFHISDKRKQLYRRLYNCAKNNIEECDVSDLKVTSQDLYVAYWALDYENPQFLELGSGYEYTMLNPNVTNKLKTVKINYGRSSDEVGQADFEARAETILAEARTQESDYEKLKYIHDWLVENTVYSATGAAYESEADGPIVYGRALCEGYSKAFMYLAQSLGFPCICSVGTAHLENHMWNMVKLGGRWYNVDVTWDDPTRTDGIQEESRHDYFLISDAQLRYDHRVNHPIMLPNASKGYFPYGYDPDSESNADDLD